MYRNRRRGRRRYREGRKHFLRENKSHEEIWYDIVQRGEVGSFDIDTIRRESDGLYSIVVDLLAEEGQNVRNVEEVFITPVDGDALHIAVYLPDWAYSIELHWSDFMRDNELENILRLSKIAN